MKLKAYFKENETARDILILSLVYILAHGFILFLTGTFWDDWTSYFHDVLAKDIEGWESGRPYYSFLIKLGWFGNSFGYRKLIFFIYYFYYLLVYLILQSIPLFKGKAPLYITVVSICVPINDARVILANFPYAIGLLLFAAGLYVFIKRVNGKKNCIQFRLLSWLLFFASFTLNSNLVMFGAVILYILITNRDLQKILGYTDFIISPILFFTLNKILFPTYGHYENYNKVTLYGLVKSVLNIPLAIFKQTGKIAYRFANSSFILLVILALIWLVFLLIDIKKNKIDEHAKNKIAIFILGTVLLILGMYPYMVVRGSAGFSIAWIDGRDAMQLGIGCAMMIYAIFPRSKQTFFTMSLALLGIFQFNTAYLQYQREWYRELSFKNELIGLDEARKIGGGNYVVYEEPASVVTDSRFYSWSAISYLALERSDLLLLNTDDDLWLLDYDFSWFADNQMVFADYNQDDDELCGYLYFTCDLSLKDTVRLKFLETFDEQAFDEQIASLGDIQFSESKL